jgi:hypothetical protein
MVPEVTNVVLMLHPVWQVFEWQTLPVAHWVPSPSEVHEFVDAWHASHAFEGFVAPGA